MSARSSPPPSNLRRQLLRAQAPRGSSDLFGVRLLESVSKKSPWLKDIVNTSGGCKDNLAGFVLEKTRALDHPWLPHTRTAGSHCFKVAFNGATVRRWPQRGL